MYFEKFALNKNYLKEFYFVENLNVNLKLFILFHQVLILIEFVKTRDKKA